MVCREQNGIIVSLGEEGHLTCSYLGTDPTVFTAPPSTCRDASFEVIFLYLHIILLYLISTLQEMERELSKLNLVIKESANGKAPM